MDRLGHVTEKVDVVDKTGATIGVLRPGSTYRVLDQSSLEFAVGVNYAMVRLPDHTVGYVPDNRLTTGPPPEAPDAAERQSAAAAPQAPPPTAPIEPDEGWSMVPLVGGLALLALLIGVVVSFMLSGNGVEGPDLAGGQLPFEVVEGDPLEAPQPVLIVGYSEEFAFGMDYEQWVDGTADAIVINRESGREVTRFPVGEGYPSGALDLGNEVWLSTRDERKIYVFDVECTCAVRAIPVESGGLDFMLEHRGSVYIGDYSSELDKSVVSELNPRTGRVERQIVVEADGVQASNLPSVVLEDETLWLAGSGNVWAVDLDGDAIERFETGLEGFVELVLHDDLVVVTGGDEYARVINLADRSVSVIDLPGWTEDNTFELSIPVVDDVEGRVWMTRWDTMSVEVIDPTTLEVEWIYFDQLVGFPAIAKGYVWVPVGNQLVVIDPVSIEVVAELPGVGASDQSESFQVEVVDDVLWLLPEGEDPNLTYHLENT